MAGWCCALLPSVLYPGRHELRGCQLIVLPAPSLLNLSFLPLPRFSSPFSPRPLHLASPLSPPTPQQLLANVVPRTARLPSSVLPMQTPPQLVVPQQPLVRGRLCLLHQRLWILWRMCPRDRVESRDTKEVPSIAFTSASPPPYQCS